MTTALPGVNGPDRVERWLGWLTLAMLAAMVAAIVRGRSEWGAVPGPVWGHLATVALALGLTPAILWRERGTARHRLLGYVWIAALAATALVSFLIRSMPGGGFSAIHILSAWTLLNLGVVLWAIRGGKVAMHRTAVRGLVIGALLIAGFFTFQFDRLLARWLYG